MNYLDIDVNSAEAVYEQIVRQIQHAVLLGTLAPGAPLPSIRQVADDLDLNPNTVAKAYKILETNRVIRTAGRKGTFIGADAFEEVGIRYRQDALRLSQELVGKLAARGLDAAGIGAAFQSALAAYFPGKEQA